MARLRYNNAGGTLGASLTSGGTTITFASAPSFATLSDSDYIPLVLEPPAGSSPSGNFEVVHLTAYTAGQTTGTISRGEEGTTAAAHSSGAGWAHSPTVQDYGLDVMNGLVVAGDLASLSSTGQALVANMMHAQRVTVPKAGTLHDLAVFPTVQSGNLIVAVYDTGDATAGSRTKLWDSGSVACPAVFGWGVVGDPALAVTPGQQLDIVLMASNATAKFLAWAGLGSGTAAMAVLPTSFIPAAGGASPKQAWTRAAGSFAMPATVTEANCAIPADFAPAIIARVA